MCPEVGPKGWFRCLPTPLVVVCVGGMLSTPFLLPAVQKWQLSFWSFCILLTIICPNCTCTQLFLVPYSLFVFCCPRRHSSRCKHRSKGSQLPVPICLVRNGHLSQNVALELWIETNTIMWPLGDVLTLISKPGDSPRSRKGQVIKTLCPLLASSVFAHSIRVATCWVWWTWQPRKWLLLDHKSVIAFFTFIFHGSPLHML